MFYIFLFLIVGFCIGHSNVLSEKHIRLNSKLQTLWLTILLFTMGFSIGSNKEILQSLPSIGGKAFLFTIAATLGSVGVVYILSLLFFQERGGKS